jgi:hypothetical protein
MKVFWKPTKEVADRQLTLQVTAPRELAGSACLVRSAEKGDEVYLYAPIIGRVQRIADVDGSRSLWGTDVTYAEIQQIHGAFSQGESWRVADQSLFDRAAFVVETDTDVAATGHDKVISYVDQSTCVLFKSELYGKTGKIIKVLTADLKTLLQVDPW